MFLYSLTLQRPTAITHAVHGNFAGTKKQLIAVARGKYIDILRAEDSGKVISLLCKGPPTVSHTAPTCLPTGS